jgi:hypothetical protein
MISFKAFVTAIHEAIIGAADALMDKNVGLLDKYFTEVPDDSVPAGGGTPTPGATKLIPKTVTLEYPHLTAKGDVENLGVAVPLITLVPLTMSRVDKAVLTADFDIELVGDEVQLNFINRSTGGMFSKKHETSPAKLEITITPQDTAEGLRMLIEGYEEVLKRQLS